jgi:hypothetical protein
MTTPTLPRRIRGVRSERLPVPHEHAEQAEVVAWAKAQLTRWPALWGLFAIPNFAGHAGGKIARLRAGSKAKREGRKAGVPDLCLPVARHGFNSLYIEVKRLQGGAVSAEQRQWHDFLRAAGHRVAVCKGAAAAIQVLEDYLT